MRNLKPLFRTIRHDTSFSSQKPFQIKGYQDSPSIKNLLAVPTWSVRSLLPPSSTSSETTAAAAAAAADSDPNAPQEITREKLHHLLKLSALPPPKSEKDESRMLQTLRDQVHFVRAVQSVDTTGWKPLVTVRDETPQAVEEATITLEKMLPYLALEDKVGRNGTVRRRDVQRTPAEDAAERATWEVDVADLGQGSDRRRKGRFFYVQRSQAQRKEAVEEGVSREGGDGVVAGKETGAS